jgi:hypothetical protein
VTYKISSLHDHLDRSQSPKRILALDGGGLRGILSLGILQRLEDLLRYRHGGGNGFRLAHYFDLIAGTSTGAIIAAALALGWKVEDIRAKYLELGKSVFEKSLLRDGLLRAKYDDRKLISELQNVFGSDTTLGSAKVVTGLMIVVKRIDTGSAWPISNNPIGQYFLDRPNGVVGNRDFPLWQVVRASTAAPSYFDSQLITIAESQRGIPSTGEFIDGGMSPYNNPSLIALMYSTLDGYRLAWPMGSDKLLLVSIGTGVGDPAVKRANLPAEQAIKGLIALMSDCASLQEIVLQWMSMSSTARTINREVGNLQHDLIGGNPHLSYLRYNVDLRPESVAALDPSSRDAAVIQSLTSMDAPENMAILHRLGVLAGERDVREDDFQTTFNLS